ncbi:MULTISPECIES: SH3 domain-containing protein [unclassified Sphingomonas]|uniref:SH3 domain-containing protein n=1 Tax=unclassified Sphingomonas TaxID=196159 RepID=UPI00028920D1|nr:MULTISPECIES: SH3 domain-containing protein [unclassified Sphingomonas]
MRIGARIMLAGTALALGAGALAPAFAAMANKKPPFYASISAKKARMRSGPARSYPANWLYQRADLPVKVIDVFEHGQWYKVEDPDGTQGWMTGGLLSETRTGLVTGQVAELRDRADAGGRIVWRAAPGVVGRLSRCSGGWCYFDVHGRGGFVEQMRFWGSEPGETLP